MKNFYIKPILISSLLTTILLTGCGEENLNESSELASGVNFPSAVNDALLAPSSNLTQEVKNTLSYMGNEERLAYDVYMKMDEYYPDVMQFKNIAQNGEIQHILAMQELIKKYLLSEDDFTNTDLTPLRYFDTEIEDMQAGIYDISTIQNLYDSLIATGGESNIKALEVACMIEVIDVNDLDHDIIIAQEANASDVVEVFNFLRDGSYSHYWAFDKGLINLGISDGCCSLGDDYCRPEYPTNENGNSSGSQDGQGQQHARE